MQCERCRRRQVAQHKKGWVLGGRGGRPHLTSSNSFNIISLFVSLVKSREIRESKDVLVSVVGLRLNIFHSKITGAFSTKRTRGFLA